MSYCLPLVPSTDIQSWGDSSEAEIIGKSFIASTATSSPAASQIKEMAAVGDPHISNMRGEHFDIFQAGVLTLLHLPRHADPNGTLLLVEADARRMGDECAVYFQAVTISGVWTNRSRPVKFLANPHARPLDMKWKEWIRFGTVELKVVHRSKGVDYLNFYARTAGQAEYEIGGLLGIDDHTNVSTRPRKCSHQHKAAVLVSSYAEALK
jgi:hypothetical protein